jgi:hypothetical protein
MALILRFRGRSQDQQIKKESDEITPKKIVIESSSVDPNG